VVGRSANGITVARPSLPPYRVRTTERPVVGPAVRVVGGGEDVPQRVRAGPGGDRGHAAGDEEPSAGDGVHVVSLS
jgi:hypothetical protein